jgi:hypothetical protein
VGQALTTHDCYRGFRIESGEALDPPGSVLDVGAGAGAASLPLAIGGASEAVAIAALVADREARQRYLGNAEAGGSALWLFAPTEDRADQLVGFLADYNYRSLRYYGDQGVKDIHRDAG